MATAMHLTCHAGERGIFGLNNKLPMQTVRLVVSFPVIFPTDASFIGMTRKNHFDGKVIDDMSEGFTLLNRFVAIQEYSGISAEENYKSW